MWHERKRSEMRKQVHTETLKGKLLGILRPKYEDGIGRNLKGIRFESGLIWLSIGPSNGCCGYCNEHRKSEAPIISSRYTFSGTELVSLYPFQYHCPACVPCFILHFKVGM
jgi:hypothetical protein